MGLFTWLFGRPATGGGDGSSAASAVVVGSIAAEYEWVGRHLPGFALKMQSLQHIGGRPYDVLELGNAAGETRTVYFDISSFFGKF